MDSPRDYCFNCPLPQVVYNMNCYLVTGGAGFIGSHLVDALIADGHRVRVLDDLSSGQLQNMPRGAELVAADVTDQQTVRRAFDGVDGCFHLAAIASVERGRDEWLRSHKVNLGGTITVFEEARRAQQSRGHSLPVVYASSAAVYGDASEIPISEGAAPRPVNTYGIDKLGCELHAAVASRIHDLRTVGLRFFNVYGPRQDPDSLYSGVISVFCQRALQGAPLEIHGDGAQVRDFVYVADAVTALRQAMAAAAATPQVYNICTGVGTTICQLGELIAGMRRRPVSILHTQSRIGDSRVSIGDPRRAREELKFTARISLLHGLRRTMDSMMPDRATTGAFDPCVLTHGD